VIYRIIIIHFLLDSHRIMTSKVLKMCFKQLLLETAVLQQEALLLQRNRATRYVS